jgi:hypothetical protein
VRPYMWKTIFGGIDNSRIFVLTIKRGNRRAEHQYNGNYKEHLIPNSIVHRTCIRVRRSIIRHRNVN